MQKVLIRFTTGKMFFKASSSQLLCKLITKDLEIIVYCAIKKEKWFQSSIQGSLTTYQIINSGPTSHLQLIKLYTSYDFYVGYSVTINILINTQQS